jgi:hypothetical protein
MVGVDLGGKSFEGVRGKLYGTKQQVYPYSNFNLDLSEAYGLIIIVTPGFVGQFTSDTNAFSHSLHLRMWGNIVRSTTMRRERTIGGGSGITFTYKTITLGSGGNTPDSTATVVSGGSLSPWYRTSLKGDIIYSTIFPVGSRGVTPFDVMSEIRNLSTDSNFRPDVAYNSLSIAALIAKK